MTSQTAEALGLAAEIGSIAPGKIADLVAFANDPAVNIRHLNEPTHVIQAGSLIVVRGA